MQTKKTTRLMALILSLLMLFTMIPLSVSAENEPETPKTILDFVETDENGNYWLEKDVTVTATATGTFTGNLDGNGHTVTTSVPLFEAISVATIQNLTVEGNVTGFAAVATLVYGSEATTTFNKVINKASVTNDVALNDGKITAYDLSRVEYVTAAGLASFVLSTTANFIDCVNEGSISTASVTGSTESPTGSMIGYASGANVTINSCTNTGAIKSNRMAAGMIGLLNNTNATISDCYNSGTVESNVVYAGGIVARKQNTGVVSIDRCTNSGAVKGVGYVGGILGYAEGNSPLTVQECGNTADITATGTPVSGGSYIAGIIGFSQQTISQLTVKYCYNTGTITSPPGKCAAGIVGRMNFLSTSTGGSKSIVDGCYNSGKIIGATDHTAQIFWATTLKNRQVLGTNFYLDSDTPAYAANGTTYNEFDNDGSKEFSESELTSGALAKTINDTVGKTVYYQNVNEGGATKDAYPVTDPTHGYVFENGGKLYSLAFFTLKTASIRLDEANHGIRFSTAVNKADYAVLTNAGIELTFGTLITPDDYLEVAGYDFTKDKLDKLKFESSNAKAYLDVTPKGNGTAVFKELKGQDNENYYYFCGSISEIKPTNYGWDYSAIGYVKIDNKEVYSGGYATRNISFIANAAYNDRQAEQAGLYTNAIAADSEYAINGVASYSPYTTDELKIIGRYLPQA